jgi:hypothetical protein
MKMLLHRPMVDGTSFYRSMPWRRIKGLEIRQVEMNKDLTWETLYDIDVCFFQRPCTQPEVRAITAAKKFNKPVIVDYDDYTLEISNYTNPAVDFYEKESTKACIRECIRMADVVIVSTEGLKHALLEDVPKANIEVVPNAMDDKLFSCEPVKGPRNNTILLRGAGSHKFDWETVIPLVKEALAAHPDYTLSVMGFHPPWLRDIPNSQLRMYEFKDIPDYYNTLFQLRPKFMVVPLVDDKFNRCKSAIAGFEGCLAGAMVFSTPLPEFKKYGYEPLEDLLWYMQADDQTVLRNHQMQCDLVPRLSIVNEHRLNILRSLRRRLYQPRMVNIPVATAQEFHDYELAHGHNQEDIHYQTAHHGFVKWLIKRIQPETAVEFGSGTGGTLYFMLKEDILATGLEINPISIEYFRGAHPIYADKIQQVDFTKEPIEVKVQTARGEQKCDVGLSIEVFEHIDMPEADWDKLIKHLSTQFKYFYFSSTPYRGTEAFDKFWGHINIRKTSDWVKLFERNGWQLVEHPMVLTGWDCLFKSLE